MKSSQKMAVDRTAGLPCQYFGCAMQHRIKIGQKGLRLPNSFLSAISIRPLFVSETQDVFLPSRILMITGAAKGKTIKFAS